jgi:hypothetical protein
LPTWDAYGFASVGGTVAHSAMANRANVINAISVMHELQSDIAKWARDYEASHVYMGESANVTIAAIWRRCTMAAVAQPA